MSIAGWLFIFLGVGVLGVVVAVYIWYDNLQSIGDWDEDMRANWNDDKPSE